MKLTKVESKMAKIQKIDLKSKDIKSEQVERLKAIFPEAVADGKINFEQLKATLGEDIEDSRERFGMTWAGKSKCFRIIQDPSTGTLKPCQKDSINFDSTKNLFIEGDNLEVLKLLQKSYYEKVKMIYIDPPYNTGSDFVYPDNFGQQLEEYLKITGQTDQEGNKLSSNTDSSGRFHSDWMNMMYPRLFLARNLLQEDGVIFISIDDNEVDNLKKIGNEIFGEENFVSQLVWKKKYTGGKHARHFVDMHEYILVYAKEIDKLLDVSIDRPEAEKDKFSEEDEYLKERGKFYVRPLKSNLELRKTLIYPIKLPDGKSIETQWLMGEDRFKKELKEDRVCFRQKRDGEYQVYKKYYEFDGDGKVKPPSLIEKYPNTEGKADLKGLFDVKEGRDNIFYTVKPKNLLKFLIESVTNENDLIMDFFAGSGSTAHAIFDLNQEKNTHRRFILVQLPELIENDKNGFKTIAEISKERIRRVIKQIDDGSKSSQKTLTDKNKLKFDLGFKVFKLDKSNFKIWDNEPSTLQTSLTDHVEQIKKTANPEDVLYEVLLKDGFELITNVKKTKIKDKEVFSIENDLLLICLDEKLTLDLFKEMKKLNPHVVIVLDKGFKDNDQLKTNAVQTLGKNSDEEYILRSI